MRKHLLALCLVLALMMTGCASSTTASQPLLIEQCKAVATQQIKAPDSVSMEKPSTPVLYTPNQIKKGVTRSEVVDNQTLNNALWEKDRIKLISLQNYIKTLQSEGIISN